MKAKVSGKCIIYAVLYQQYDGFPTGPSSVGKRLLALLKGMQVVNGIPFGKPGKFANGAGDLFAQIISHFKGGQVGGAYLQPPVDDLEEYNYVVVVDDTDKTIRLSILDGSGQSLDPTIDSNDGASAETWIEKLEE